MRSKCSAREPRERLLRVVVLADRLSDRGGADWHLLGVLDALASSHELDLGVGRIDPRCEAQPPSPPQLLPVLAERLDREAGVRQLDHWVAKSGADVVHLHNVVNPAVLRWAADKTAVLTIQDHRFFCPGQGKLTAHGARCTTVLSREACAACFSDPGYFDDIYRLTQARLEATERLRVIVLGNYMKRELVAAGLQAERIETIPPFVHGLDFSATAEGPPCALFVGRLTATKGIDDAVAAWKRSGVDLPLVFAGSGPERARLQQEGHQVLGWLNRAQLSQVYRAARVLVMPSRWQEPFGIVGLEAHAMGVPVAAWDSGGVAEWHPGGVGLVPWGDVDGLARAIAALADTDPVPPAALTHQNAMAPLEDLYRSLTSPN